MWWVVDIHTCIVQLGVHFYLVSFFFIIESSGQSGLYRNVIVSLIVYGFLIFHILSCALVWTAGQSTTIGWIDWTRCLYVQIPVAIHSRGARASEGSFFFFFFFKPSVQFKGIVSSEVLPYLYRRPTRLIDKIRYYFFSSYTHRRLPWYIFFFTRCSVLLSVSFIRRIWKERRSRFDTYADRRRGAYTPDQRTVSPLLATGSKEKKRTPSCTHFPSFSLFILALYVVCYARIGTKKMKIEGNARVAEKDCGWRRGRKSELS